MRLTTQRLKKLIREELNKKQLRKTISESDRFYGVIPLELWEISDYEDATDTFGFGAPMDAFFKKQTTEHLQMKIEQLEEEIQYEMDNLDDPYAYDDAVALKESLRNYIEEILISRQNQ